VNKRLVLMIELYRISHYIGPETLTYDSTFGVDLYRSDAALGVILSSKNGDLLLNPDACEVKTTDTSWGGRIRKVNVSPWMDYTDKTRC